MSATLYWILGSHAVRTGTHRVLVRVAGFPGDRVPAVELEDGRRAQGTREIPRVLDELRPEPRLVPDDPSGLEAERWADEVLQEWAPASRAAGHGRRRAGFRGLRLRRVWWPVEKSPFGPSIEGLREL